MKLTRQEKLAAIQAGLTELANEARADAAARREGTLDKEILDARFEYRQIRRENMLTAARLVKSGEW